MTTESAVSRSAETKKIILPAGMSKKAGADILLREDKEDEKVVLLHYEIDCFPLDGAVALRDTLDEVYGYAPNTDTPGWFGSNPPVMIGVPVGYGTAPRQVPWGRVEIPNVYGYLQTNLTANPYPKFILHGETKQRHLHEIEELVEKLKARLKTDSIYKGKAVKLDLSWIREGENFHPMSHAPQFSIDVDAVNPEELILPADAYESIDTNLFGPIEESDHCRHPDHRVPLKRGVLLAGEPGTGKTLCAYVTAKKATQNGWTFVYLSDVRDLALGFRFAAQYAPAVLFAEDMDRVVSGDERTSEIDAVLNSFDGVETKNLELITVLTTNHHEKIPQVAKRNGRCDVFVELPRPDAAAAARMVAMYGRGLIAEDADYDRIGEALAGKLPATIREAVERSKLATIRRLRREGALRPGGSIRGLVREQDVLAATASLEVQHRMLQPRARDTRSLAEKCFDALGARTAEAISDGVDRNAALLVSLIQASGAAGAADVRSASKYLRRSEDVPSLNGN